MPGTEGAGFGGGTRVGTELNKTQKPSPLSSGFYSTASCLGPGLSPLLLPLPGGSDSASLPTVPRPGDEASACILHILHVPGTAELHLPRPGMRAVALAAPASLRFFQRASASLHRLFPLSARPSTRRRFPLCILSSTLPLDPAGCWPLCPALSTPPRSASAEATFTRSLRTS